MQVSFQRHGGEGVLTGHSTHLFGQFRAPVKRTQKISKHTSLRLCKGMADRIDANMCDCIRKRDVWKREGCRSGCPVWLYRCASRSGYFGPLPVCRGVKSGVISESACWRKNESVKVQVSVDFSAGE